jgi:cation:H+ antiporter
VVARRLGVTALALGVLVAGAEPEELTTALVASVRHRPAIAAGDAIGANVTMLTLVIGLASLARPLPVGARVRPYAVAAVATGALAAGAIADNDVSRVEGAILLLAYLGLVALIWLRERRPPAIGELVDLDDSNSRGEQTGMALLLVAAGIAAMAAGGRLAVAGAERVVRTLGVRDSAVGLTLVALATTAELFALVVAATRRGVEELAVAAIVGSAAYNATATLGLAAIVHPIHANGIRAAAWAAVALPLPLLAYSLRGRVPRSGGAALVVAYGVFVGLTLR